MHAEPIRTSEKLPLIAGLGLILASGLVVGAAGDAAASQAGAAEEQQTLKLLGVIRDFRDEHPDFERRPLNASGKGAFGHYIEIAADQLGGDGKPVYRSGGRRVSRQWRDAQGRNVTPIFSGKSYITQEMGDEAGSAQGVGSAVVSADTFAQWFRDVPGVNQSATLALELTHDPATGNYVFDDRLDEFYVDAGGFFPINGQLYGDYRDGKNFHFTFELNTQFTYEEGSGQEFTFNGDDDVFVYIDGKLVIDLGGIHSQIEQTIALDRLDWLEDGKVYDLDFFFAERHTTQSNFRIETNIALRPIDPPQVTALYD